MNNIYRINNKINGSDNNENDSHKNNLFSGNLNKSEIISPNESIKTKKFLSHRDNLERKIYNDSNKNKDNDENPGT